MRAAPFLIALLARVFLSGAQAGVPAADAPQKPDAAAIEQCLSTQKAALKDRGICIGAVYNECMSRAEGETTYGIMDCQHREIAVWDSKLNETYKALLKDASPKLKSSLRSAQRAWVKDRDKSCLLPYAYFEGGTMAGPMGGDCVNEMTARRYLFLDDYLHFAE